MDKQKLSENLNIRGLSKENIWDYENGFYWFSHPTRINKLLAHYDLYKSIIHLPGEVFELGVYKAASLVRLASFRNLLENDCSRKIVGFDAFGKFPMHNLTYKADLDFIEKFEKEGGEGLPLDDVETIFRQKNFQNISLNKGNVFDTLPKYLDKFPATRIAFLHLDMDVKEPTAYSLELLYERVVPGGLIVLDDYGSVAGETDAVDAFVKKHSYLKIEKTTHYHVPAFIRKP